MIGCSTVAWLMKGVPFDADIHHLNYHTAEVDSSEQLLKSKTASTLRQKYFASTGVTMEEAIVNFKPLARQLDSLQRAGLVRHYSHTHLILVGQQEQRARIAAWYRYWTPERLSHVRQLIASTAPTAGLEADQHAGLENDHPGQWSLSNHAATTVATWRGLTSTTVLTDSWHA